MSQLGATRNGAGLRSVTHGRSEGIAHDGLSGSTGSSPAASGVPLLREPPDSAVHVADCLSSLDQVTTSPKYVPRNSV